MESNIIPAVNLHLTKSCNMKCKYCFAHFYKSIKKHPYNTTIQLIKILSDFGFSKINFVGGEPMLVKELSEYVNYAKELGFYTSIVSNGTMLNSEFLEKTKKSIDMFGISIDSLKKETNEKIGRIKGKKAMGFNEYKQIINLIKVANIALKINTVVSKQNYKEDFSEFINYANPDRWKIFQVLRIEGENENNVGEFEIEKSEYDEFISLQERSLLNKNMMIRETTELIKGSYLMINPDGSFFGNSSGKYQISEPIIEVGVEKALQQISFDYNKFINRRGNFFLAV